MVTFLPFASFLKSAICLDKARLGKQRIECLQLLTSIYWPEIQKREDIARIVLSNDTIDRLGEKEYSKGVTNHPARVMWERDGLVLATYGKVICEEWIARGCRDDVLRKIETFGWLNPDVMLDQEWMTTEGMMPEWLGYQRFHDSHRSQLLSKDYEWYRHFGWTVPAGLPYFWPSKEILC